MLPQIAYVEKFLNDTESKKPQKLTLGPSNQWDTSFAAVHEALDEAQKELAEAQENYAKTGGKQDGFEAWSRSNAPHLWVAVGDMERAASFARQNAQQLGV